jgi:2-methylisocitrate lyase-like PEP mutase family enzyme
LGTLFKGFLYFLIEKLKNKREKFMKLIITHNGKKLKISKKEWEEAGLKFISTPSIKASKTITAIKDELEEGIKIEKEHKDIYYAMKDKFGEDFDWTLDEFSKEIAQDHIDEIDDYYTRLKKMEKDA